MQLVEETVHVNFLLQIVSNYCQCFSDGVNMQLFEDTHSVGLYGVDGDMQAIGYLFVSHSHPYTVKDGFFSKAESNTGGIFYKFLFIEVEAEPLARWGNYGTLNFLLV